MWFQINCAPLSAKVQPVLIAQKVCAGVFLGVTTTELDDLAAETACYMSTDCRHARDPHHTLGLPGTHL